MRRRYVDKHFDIVPMKCGSTRCTQYSVVSEKKIRPKRLRLREAGEEIEQLDGELEAAQTAAELRRAEVENIEAELKRVQTHKTQLEKELERDTERVERAKKMFFSLDGLRARWGRCLELIGRRDLLGECAVGAAMVVYGGRVEAGYNIGSSVAPHHDPPGSMDRGELERRLWSAVAAGRSSVASGWGRRSTLVELLLEEADGVRFLRAGLAPEAFETAVLLQESTRGQSCGRFPILVCDEEVGGFVDGFLSSYTTISASSLQGCLDRTRNGLLIDVDSEDALETATLDALESVFLRRGVLEAMKTEKKCDLCHAHAWTPIFLVRTHAEAASLLSRRPTLFTIIDCTSTVPKKTPFAALQLLMRAVTPDLHEHQQKVLHKGAELIEKVEEAEEAILDSLGGLRTRLSTGEKSSSGGAAVLLENVCSELCGRVKVLSNLFSERKKQYDLPWRDVVGPGWRTFLPPARTLATLLETIKRVGRMTGLRRLRRGEKATKPTSSARTTAASSPFFLPEESPISTADVLLAVRGRGPFRRGSGNFSCSTKFVLRVFERVLCRYTYAGHSTYSTTVLHDSSIPVLHRDSAQAKCGACIQGLFAEAVQMCNPAQAQCLELLFYVAMGAASKQPQRRSDTPLSSRNGSKDVGGGSSSSSSETNETKTSTSIPREPTSVGSEMEKWMLLDDQGVGRSPEQQSDVFPELMEICEEIDCLGQASGREDVMLRDGIDDKTQTTESCSRMSSSTFFYASVLSKMRAVLDENLQTRQRRSFVRTKTQEAELARNGGGHPPSTAGALDGRPADLMPPPWTAGGGSTSLSTACSTTIHRAFADLAAPPRPRKSIQVPPLDFSTRQQQLSDPDFVPELAGVVSRVGPNSLLVAATSNGRMQSGGDGSMGACSLEETAPMSGPMVACSLEETVRFVACSLEETVRILRYVVPERKHVTYKERGTRRGQTYRVVACRTWGGRAVSYGNKLGRDHVNEWVVVNELRSRC